MSDKKPYKVMENDGHSHPIVHVFRDKQHFIKFMTYENFDSFDNEEWEDVKEFKDHNHAMWSEYSGLLEVDHTKDK